MPTAILLAGPNGAGKTTFASAYLADGAAGVAFLNADEVARELPPGLAPAQRDLQAGRVVLARLEALIAARRDLVVETTLSSRLYARRIPAWRDAGYRVALIYLRLPDARSSIARVAERVERGGHDIAAADLLRRYERSVRNLEEVYKPMVDEWRVWRGRGGRFELLESSGP